MIKLQAHQLQALATGRSSRFSERLHAHLQASYAGHLTAWPAGALAAFADAVMRAAPQWGFRAERDIAELAMLMLEVKLAANPPRMPEWFQRIVSDESLHAPAKLYHLIATWQQELPRARLAHGFAGAGAPA